MKKILFVANIIGHIDSFHIPYIKWLKEQNYIIHVAANGDESIPYVDKQFNIPIQRSPYKIQNFNAYKQLKKIIAFENYDLVHCHTPMGGLLGRIAAINTQNKGTKVMYTAHGFHFCKGAPLINWMIYYPIEKFMCRYTDVLITINSEDFNTAKKFNIKNHYAIPGIGFDIEKFKDVLVDKGKKRSELKISNDESLIMSVGDLTTRKNHEVVIRAIAKINNMKIKYVICGEGELCDYLKNLSFKLGISDKVMFLGHRRDINQILRAADIFVFPSLWEGLGIAGLEAMASGIPVIASKRHGILDYVIDEKTGLLCEPRDDIAFSKAICRLVEDKSFSKKLVDNAYNVISKFDIVESLKKMKKIYIEVLEE